MNVSEFVSKWQKVELPERSASQQHFLGLCEVFDHPKPALDDPSGERFTFEKGAAKHGGGQGWADVWKRGFFGWEYKGKHKDLNAAYDQLLRYREALESPPLLVVCDMDRFIIHTNFTATVGKTYEISLDDLNTPRNIENLRNVFHIGTVKYPRLVPKGDIEAEQLAKRTLTNLYNERPTAQANKAGRPQGFVRLQSCGAHFIRSRASQELDAVDLAGRENNLTRCRAV